MSGAANSTVANTVTGASARTDTVTGTESSTANGEYEALASSPEEEQVCPERHVGLLSCKAHHPKSDSLHLLAPAEPPSVFLCFLRLRGALTDVDSRACQKWGLRWLLFPCIVTCHCVAVLLYPVCSADLFVDDGSHAKGLQAPAHGERRVAPGRPGSERHSLCQARLLYSTPALYYVRVSMDMLLCTCCYGQVIMYMKHVQYSFVGIHALDKDGAQDCAHMDDLAQDALHDVFSSFLIRSGFSSLCRFNRFWEEEKLRRSPLLLRALFRTFWQRSAPCVTLLAVQFPGMLQKWKSGSRGPSSRRSGRGAVLPPYTPGTCCIIQAVLHSARCTLSRQRVHIEYT